MRHVFHDPRSDEPDPRDYSGGNYYPEENYPPEEEPAGPYDPLPPESEPEPEPEAEPERARTGCSWLLIFILLVAVGIVTLASWNVTRMVGGMWVKKIHQDYQMLSPLPAERVQVPQAELQLQIYYIARGRALAPETRRLRKPASENERLRLIAQELMQPPTGKLLENPLPRGTQIHGIYLLGGIAYVDLSIEFTKADQPTPLKEKLAVYALVNSLMLNNRSIQGVQIMIDGHPAITAWGWLDLSSPLGPDLSLQAPPPGTDEGA